MRRRALVSLAVGPVLLLGACSGGEADPSSTLPFVETTTTTVVEAERIVRFELRLDEGETELRTTLVGGPGESVVLLGDGTDSAPSMRLLDAAGTELAAGAVDAVFPDLTDLAYRFTSDEPVTLEMEATDSQRFRLRIDASPGVEPTLFDGTRSQLPLAGEYLYRADGDVLVISTAAALDGSVVVERVDGDERFSESAVGLVRFPATRWFVEEGTYRVRVDGRVGAVSISSRSTGLDTPADVQAACSSFQSIERLQLSVGGELAPVSALVGESLSGGRLDTDWLAELKGAVLAAEPAVEALNLQYGIVRAELPVYFGQDLVDVQNGIYSSWTRLRDAAADAGSARQFFELIATSNDSRLIRIGESAGYSLLNLDSFTTQVCGFSIRSPEIGLEA